MQDGTIVPGAPINFPAKEKHMKASFLLISLLSAGVAFAAPPAPKQEGIEGKNYQWNAQAGEKVEALTKKGDKKAAAAPAAKKGK